MPAGAVELSADSSWPSERALAVAALRQVLANRGGGLPFGPETAAEEEGRLLTLNRFVLQLATSGLMADQIAVDVAPWAEEATAPQILLAAHVDEENAVVSFGGVLTSEEFVALAASAERNGDQLLLEADAFKGDLERLFTLVQLLDPSALPRLSLRRTADALLQPVVAIVDWLNGHIDAALQQVFGAHSQPLMEGAFRSGTASVTDADALALVAIPLGLNGNQLVCAEAADRCIQRFVLQMVATGVDRAHPTGLRLLLRAALEGDLLPDGLGITARQGSHEQRQSSDSSTLIELVFSGGEALIHVTLSFPGSSDLVLPPLQLPG